MNLWFMSHEPVFTDFLTGVHSRCLPVQMQEAFQIQTSVHVNIKFLVAVREPVTLELVELYVFESNVFRTLNLDSCTSAARKNRTYFPGQ